MNRLIAQHAGAALLATAVLLGVASQAQAHAHLLSATPAPNAAVAAGSRTVALHFSEPLMARFSSFDLATSAGAKVAMARPALDPRDHKAMSAALRAPLKSGAYRLTWRAVTADTHRVQGSYTFKVN